MGDGQGETVSTVGGEAGRLIRTLDWSRHPFGPPATWPEALRALTTLMLNSGQPMFLAWGPERRMLYNDAYAEIMGHRHPGGMGQRFDVVWADILDQVGWIMDAGYAGAPTSMDDLTLTMIRDGVETETHFAFAYTPIRDASDAVCGVFCSCIETTRRVAAERRAAEAAALVDSAINSGVVIGAWVWEVGPNIVRGDARLAELFARTDEEAATGLSLESFVAGIHEEDRDRVRAEIARVVETPGPYHCEYRVIDRKGRTRWVLASGKVIEDAEGRAALFPGVLIDIERQRRAAADLQSALDQRTLLGHELEHRIKNILAMVTAIAHQSLRPPATVEQAAAAFSKRIQALARAQDILTRSSWTDADIGDVVREGLTMDEDDAQRVRAVGPPIRLPAKAALSLGLAIHELATNAVKYGALSTPDGRVDVEWRIDETGASTRFIFEWRESGGPPVSAPQRRGFGSRLIRSVLAGEFGGEVEMDFDQKGLLCRLNAPYPVGVEAAS